MDNLIKEAVKRDFIRKPSKGFSDRVMNDVFAIKSRPFVYQPVISKTKLIGIFVALSSFVCYALFVNPSTPSASTEAVWSLKFSNLFNEMNFSGELSIVNYVIEFISNSLVSNFTVYLGITFAVFILLLVDSIVMTKKMK